MRFQTYPSAAVRVQHTQSAAPNEANVALRLEHLAVSYGERAVLQDVNLQIEEGAFVAIIGVSGCGKSTLLKVLAGLLKPQQGEVTVTGKTAVVFQDYRLLPWRTAAANVALPQELAGVPEAARGTLASSALRRVGLAAHGESYPNALSGGMQARVAIARALAQNAEIILLDEPFAALDALTRERFNLELRRLHAKTGKTVVLVTHSIEEAAYLAEKVVVLHEGRVREVLDTRAEGARSLGRSPLVAHMHEVLEPQPQAAAPVAVAVKAPRVAPLRFAFLWLSLTLILWQVAASQSTPLLLPAPLEVFTALLAQAGALLRHAGATLGVTLLGLLCALAIGAPLGYVMARSRLAEALLSPPLVALQAVPTVIVAPLLVSWLGYGLPSRVIVAALICVFPLIITTMTGVRQVDERFIETFKSFGARPWQTFWGLELPGALPYLLSGLKLATSLALIGTVVSEFVFGGGGLGFFTSSERLNFHLDAALAGVVVMVALALSLYGLLGWLEAQVTRHYPTTS